MSEGFPKKSERDSALRAVKSNKDLTTIKKSKESEWPTYDSSIMDFELTFWKVLPESFEMDLPFGRFPKYIEEILSNEIKGYDKEHGHFVIEGDVLNPEKNSSTLASVIKKLGRPRTDLIISRMEGALRNIDKHPAILDRIIRNWYRILNENGLMFIQHHYGLFVKVQYINQLKRWSEFLKHKVPQIDIQLTAEALRLHKKAGAPAELPSAAQLFK